MEDRLKFSFEFFPPKTEEGAKNLVFTTNNLNSVNPVLFTVTYGAGGTTQDRTFDTITKLKELIDTPIASHLTAVNKTKAEIDAIADQLWAMGVRHLVALRGDPPKEEGWREIDEGNYYPYSSMLIEALKSRHPFTIFCSAYPECHPEAECLNSDIDALLKKQAAGADYAITQYFFETKDYLDFVDKARAAGVTIPIIPGLMAIHNFEGIKKFSKGCGASIPDWLSHEFAGAASKEEHDEVAANILERQITELAAHGITRFHIYSMNRTNPTLEVCQKLSGKNVLPVEKRLA